MKKILKWVLIALVVFALFSLWYNWKYSMGVADSNSINQPTLEYKLLLITQKSEYKDAVTKNIASYFKGKDIYISIIDVTEMAEVDLDNFQRFVIIHTYEMWKPPKQIVAFLEKENIKNKVFTVSTSGDGNLIPEGVDGVTSASVITDAEEDAQEVIEWIKTQFKLEA